MALLSTLFCYSMGWVGLSGFNVGLEQRKNVIADSLGVTPKDEPEIWHRNFDLPRMGWLPQFDTPRGII